MDSYDEKTIPAPEDGHRWHGAERGVRLAREHLKDAADALAQTPLASDPGNRRATPDWIAELMARMPSRDEGSGVRFYLGRGQSEQQAMREMTPDEIRADEATGLLERISLIDKTTGPYGYRGETERILRGRIDALRPEQTSSKPSTLSGAEAAQADRFPGLSFRQEAKAGITISPNAFLPPTRIDGAVLDITLRLVAEGRAYDIPPYQVDQLRAIADGRPSWPNVSPPQVDEPEVVAEEAQPLDQMSELLEKVGNDVKTSMRRGGIEGGLRLLGLWSENKDLLTVFSAALLGDAVCDAIKDILRGASE